MSVITSGGDLVHYEVLGRGRAVVLLHGCLGSWRYWVPTMQTLQLKYRCYALDMFGFGDTVKNANKYVVEHQIALIADLMSELGITKMALIGHDVGAIVAAEFARQYHERVARLLLVSPPLYDPGDLEHRVPAARSVPVGVPARTTITRESSYSQDPAAETIMSPSSSLQALRMAQAAKAAEAARSRGTMPSSDEGRRSANAARAASANPLIPVFENSLESLLARCFKRSEPSYDKLNVDLAKTDPQAVRAVVQNFDPGHLLDTLRLLPMPTVVIHGAEDTVFPQPSEDVWNYITLDKEHLLPILLPGVRHFPMLEDEKFLRLLNDFLEAPDVSRLELKERWRRRTR
jgi:pimeloyl-ACP methyl ester carboxylesterase